MQCLVKIISKVLANRIKCILPTIINESSQSTFVPGRAFTNNVIVAFEIIHRMKGKSRGKFKNVALKIDIIKAYDRIKWAYIETMLEKLRFEARWIKLIMTCVSTVTYKISVNGELVGPLMPNLGIVGNQMNEKLCPSSNRHVAWFIPFLTDVSVR